MWSLKLPLVKFGTLARQRAYLPGLVSGDLIGMHAMTEPDSRSDAFSMRARAERQDPGMVIFNSLTARERSRVLASALGTMRRQLEACVEYPRTRKQFGQSIGKLQAVSNSNKVDRVRLAEHGR